MLENETILKANELYKSDRTEIAVEFRDISFRLYKTKEGTINFEVFVVHQVSSTPLAERPSIGILSRFNEMKFTKPIGFFDFSGEVTQLSILYEFIEAFERLPKDAYSLLVSLKISSLTIEVNAIIAAFSMEAICEAEKYEDTVFIANGLNCEICMSKEGYPQFFVEDKYKVEGPIASYPIREHGKLNPSVDFKKLFDLLSPLELFTHNNSWFRVEVTEFQWSVLLTKAIIREAFPQPQEGDLYFQSSSQIFVLFIRGNYFKFLKHAIISAKFSGKFSRSNAEDEWNSITNQFQNSLNIGTPNLLNSNVFLV